MPFGGLDFLPPLNLFYPPRGLGLLFISPVLKLNNEIPICMLHFHFTQHSNKLSHRIPPFELLNIFMFHVFCSFVGISNQDVREISFKLNETLVLSV